MISPISLFRKSVCVLVGIVPLALIADDSPETAVPVVDARTMEVSVTRHQDTLWRYTRFSTESDYPCLRFEAIQPDEEWRVVDRRDVCEVPLGEGLSLAFRDTAYTGFTEVSFSPAEDAFLFQVEYMGRTAQGEKAVSCALPVAGSRLGTLRCY